MSGPNPPYPPQQPHYGQYPPPRKRKVWPWVLLGVVVLAFGGCVAIVGTAGKEVSKAVDAASSSIQSAADSPTAAVPPLSAKPPAGKGKTVVYEIVSDASALSSVTYFDQNSALQQETGAEAPWSKTVVNNSTAVIVGLGAQTNGTSVTCRIIIDGKVKDEKTSTGKYAVVNCSGSA